ncbi:MULTISPECIES: Gfo/Idh/MocA family oxidoreductase [unclassified Ensifer]|uniref:Gfo/Idh/MocA family protein n=1 Tax=unclassified Ensifer TaxID=2633371 RepID=UPI0008132A03|nr:MULTISPECIES: Gfo/Idh/MocA family oxidoreductase [unclassified Ensifer]OCP09679.1 oxidoreductase [Ensifer sp. LC13]OCP10781.1 oxidoreductase [Ensifer sp. LC11]OCP14106.1 oxidoreductase [Ensifer sp. LC14]OCP32857.1 oxidoreductase [Ensifer sp. LC499]
MTTLANHPQLRLAGVWDRDAERLDAFTRYWAVSSYASLEAVLADPAVSIVVNLTTPDSHYTVNRATLLAGKHVYCEKPLAMTVDEASELVALARDRALVLSGAPANALSDAHALCASLLQAGAIGTPRLVYAEMEDGPVFKANWRAWRSRSGARWPGVHEFEVGCTLEHAGYAASWLVSLFGPVAEVSAVSALTFPDKGPGTETLALGPDFSVGCLAFRSGVTARVTCGLAAPRDRSLTVIGDKGTISVRDLWDNRSPIHVEAFGAKRSLTHRGLDWLEWKLGRKLPVRLYPGTKVRYPKAPSAATLPAFPSQIDFMRGIAVQAQAIAGGETPYFSGATARHLTEVVLALNSGWRDYRPLDM